MANVTLQHSLLQYSVSHDHSKIIENNQYI